MTAYDYLVVGAGAFGATFAWCARQAGKTVLVVDRRDHIAGNCHSYDVDGIEVHAYGPHVFHTSDLGLWTFVNRFARFNDYRHRVRAKVDNKIISLPFNMMTMHQLWGVTTPAEAREQLERQKVACANPQNVEEWALATVGTDIYETLVREYIVKQWGRQPNELPALIIKRLPVRMNWDDRYFSDAYQGIPISGYDQIFAALLEGCDVQLGVNFVGEDDPWAAKAKHVVCSSSMDEYYDYALGDLQYRTLAFKTERFDIDDMQGMAHISYPTLKVPYTRSVEHKHFEPDKHTKHTVVTWETPHEKKRADFPYYPINDRRNNALHERYRARAERDSHVTFGGRAGNYRYYDIHQAMAQAMTLARKHGLMS